MTMHADDALAFSYCLADYPKKIQDFLIQFPDFQSFKDAALSGGVFLDEIPTDAILSRLRSFDLKNFKMQLNRFDISVVTLVDSAYPELLKEIVDPPMALYYQGDISLLNQSAIAVVGPRKMTDYGKAVTEYMVSALASELVIVSGLAEGVDTVAHQIALREGGKTVAVLGHGLDSCFPPQNKGLKQVLAQKGLVVSEYPPGVPPQAFRFPHRNRIVSGLSLGVLVAEAVKKSGSLITARLALEQNRDVFAIPGSVFSLASEGVHALIQDGAKLVHSPSDILLELGLSLSSEKVTQVPLFSENVSDDLTDSEKTLLAYLSPQGVHLDYIMSKSERPISDVLQNLTQLELKQKIVSLPGMIYRLNV